MGGAPPRVRDLQGLWRRSLLLRPDGARDTATEVRWLQGIETYIDLRQPALQPKFPDKRRLADLSRDECAVLARQEGFAGRLTFDGAHFEWVRDIDFQPPTLHADAAALWWEGGTLIERGRDVDYLEHWHRDASSRAPPTAAVSLRDSESGTSEQDPAGVHGGGRLGRGGAGPDRLRDLVRCGVGRGVYDHCIEPALPGGR
jgi:hypothetical protein